MSSKKNVVLDISTLEELLKEASENYDEANETFEETDCTEAMHATEQWQATVAWLDEKIKKQKKLALLKEKN
jgi:hypothetical protein